MQHASDHSEIRDAVARLCADFPGEYWRKLDREMAYPAVMSKFWIAGMLELIGGALLVVGLFSRPVAFILSGLMAAAYWMAHAPQGPFPALNGGDAAILYCFVFLYIVFAGPGPISLDKVLGRDG